MRIHLNSILIARDKSDIVSKKVTTDTLANYIKYSFSKFAIAPKFINYNR